jgi:penicillin amidase
MHLPLMAPNIWYRAAFVWPGHRVVGVTLPGTPAMVVGSNGRVAWGFTNTEADTSDLVALVRPPVHSPDYYATADDVLRLDEYEETIRVHGGPDRTITVEESVYGPVIGRDRLGRRLALRWVAHERGAVNFELMRLESVRTVEEALAIGPRCGTPAQNLTVADSQGRIGWTILGRLPNRIGYEGRTPSRSIDPGRRWDGFLPAEQYPRLSEPPTGRIWTANNRTVGRPHPQRLGVGGFDVGARAQQIRDGLLARDKVSEADMLAIQLDDRAIFLTRWQELMVEVLSADRKKGARRESMLREVRAWGARAAIDSVGYRLVSRFRSEVTRLILSALTAPCRRADNSFEWRFLDHNVEESVYLLATQRPAHLLPPGHADWEALLLACVDRVTADVEKKGPLEERLPAYTWGAENEVRVRNPLSSGVGPLAKWLRLDMPTEQLPGDARMPRVQTPTFGASQRMAVSPGREEEGYFMMPAGQSGHPLSPHYRDGHDDWAKGRPAPFLPGPAAKVLRLRAR